MTTPLYTLSISARATLDMHSLNNEGGEGNQIQTRMVNIVDGNGDLHNVNAISGDMFKHIQAEHLFNISRQDPNLLLCAGCQEFNANRSNADSDFLDRTKDAGDAALTDEMLRTCVMDDIQGILITENKRSLPRKSVIEFGWVIGVPGKVETDSYFHVKYALKDRTKSAEQRDSENALGANLGQVIFHRPASSGIYAAICHIDFSRIGFNDITQTYAIDEEQRARRAKALLESVLYTFMNPRGAMRSTQAPHLINFEGVVSTSSSPTPAPTISPIKADYVEQIGAIWESLKQIAPDAIEVFDFNALGGFSEIMGELMKRPPVQLIYK